MIWPRSQGCSLAILVLRHWYYSVLRKHGLTNVVANVWASVQCFSSGITFSYWNFCNKLKNRWLLVLVFINFFVSLMYSSWSCPKLFTIIVPLSTLVRNFFFPFEWECTATEKIWHKINPKRILIMFANRRRVRVIFCELKALMEVAALYGFLTVMTPFIQQFCFVIMHYKKITN